MTSHRLGGSIANLLVADILIQKSKKSMNQVNLMGAYTFGAPRIGDARFAFGLDFFTMYNNVSMYLVRDTADIVTGIPLGVTKYPGYWHAGSLVYLDAKGGVYYGNGWQDIET